MTLTDITLPEVKVYTQSAKFFRRGEEDFVEISFVGAKDTLVERVKPSHMAAFRHEWDAYCDGRPAQRREGIALTELPGIDDEKAESYFARNVHTLEELAALSDAQCQGIGHGTLTDRQGARKVVMQRQLEARDRMQRAVHEASAAIGPKPAERYVASGGPRLRQSGDRGIEAGDRRSCRTCRKGHAAAQQVQDGNQAAGGCLMALSTLLEIGNRAADELSLAQQSAYVGSIVPDARTLLACANAAGRDLMRAHDWGALQTLGTITTANGTASYPLASDYDRMISDTGWDRTNDWMMVGPDTPQVNRYLNESAVAQTGARKRFRLQGTSIVIFPTPTAIEALVYEYVSNKWARSSIAVAQAEFAADTDTTVFDPDLMRAEIKWRYLAAKGMAFDDARAEAMTIRESRIAADLGGAKMSMAPASGAQFIELDNLPDNSWLL